MLLNMLMWLRRCCLARRPFLSTCRKPSQHSTAAQQMACHSTYLQKSGVM